MWYVYTVKYYLAIKNEVLLFAATWMVARDYLMLEIIMLSEVSQTKTNISLVYGI